MTRGTLALLHGDVPRSLTLNPGIVLAVLVIVYLLWRRPPLRIPTWLPWAILGGLWSYQLFKFATGRPL